MKRAAVAVVIVCLPIVAGVALAMDNAHRSQPQTMSLLGNPRVMSKVAHRRAGSAEIFPFVSRTNGTATAIRIYVDRRNRSTKLFVGVYLYRNGRPGRRLRYGQLSRPRGGHWNSVKISRVGIRSGHRYGISVLGRSGSLYFRYRTGNRCRGAQADQLSVKTLPASWGAAHQHSACAISAYVVGKREPSADPTTLPPAGTPVGSPAPSGAPAAVVGSAGEPATACSTTLNPGANVQGALAAAAAGGVVCLNAGNWTAQTLTGLSPASPGVTLAAAPGAIGQVNMAGITTTGTVNNLTVEGINFSDTFAVHAGANNIALKYSDFQHFPDYAIELCAGCVNGGPSIDNVTMSYNQIDYTAYCLRVASDGGNYTFSHNVCGPGIGEGGDSDDHYIQAENNNNVTIDNNAFQGPANAAAIANGAHLNVTHQCGNNLQFDNNILWRTNAVAQSLLWGDDCTVNGGEASNNLIIEAPSPDTYSLWIDNANNSSNVTFSNDTVVDSFGYGGIVNKLTPGFTAHYDLAANDGNNAYDGFTGCACSNNASDDHTGELRWTPSWQSTTWTPNDGSPWNPPRPTTTNPRVSPARSATRASLDPEDSRSACGGQALTPTRGRSASTDVQSGLAGNRDEARRIGLPRVGAAAAVISPATKKNEYGACGNDMASNVPETTA